MLLQKRPYIYWILLLATLLIGNLISSRYVLGQQIEIPIEQAIQDGQVTASFRGISPEGIFREPMLQLDLTNESSTPITIIIPQELTLGSTSDNHADIVVLGENVELPLASAPNSPLRKELFAYSLDHTKSFPDETIEYRPEDIEISPELMNVFDNIVILGTEQDLTSQIAVWLTHKENITIEQLETDLRRNFSVQQRLQITQIRWGIDVIRLLLGGLFLVFLIAGAGFAVWWWRSTRAKRNLLIANLEDYVRIHDGYMSEVYLAFDKRQDPPQKIIAKFPKIEDADSNRNKNINYRFKNEIKFLKKSKGEQQNIVEFLESGQYPHPKTKQQTPYLLEAFIEGITLEELLKRQNSLTELLILEITTQILDALEYIHGQVMDIVHRDLTWGNIMIDNRGKVHIIDFGIATHAGSSYTQVVDFSAFHTSPFAAPEIGEKFPANKKSDFYSLAVLMYAMYGGRISKNINRENILEHLKNLEGISENVWEVLERCLSEKINERPKDVSEIKEALYLPQDQLARMVKNPEYFYLETEPFKPE